MRPDDDSLQGRSPEIRIEAELVRELGSRYAEYRQAMSAPFDPVSVLALTGQILETVEHILKTTEHTGGVCPNTGRTRQSSTTTTSSTSEF